MSRPDTTVTTFRMTAFPPGCGPYERWEVTVEQTGEVLISGLMPIDNDAVQAALDAYRRRSDPEKPWRSATCDGEVCGMCGQPASSKIGEEIAWDDPQPVRHNLTSYVCAYHFAQIMGPAGAQLMERKAP